MKTIWISRLGQLMLAALIGAITTLAFAPFLTGLSLFLALSFYYLSSTITAPKWAFGLPLHGDRTIWYRHQLGARQH